MSKPHYSILDVQTSLFHPGCPNLTLPSWMSKPHSSILDVQTSLFYPGCPNLTLPSRSNHTSTLSDFHHPEKVCPPLPMCYSPKYSPIPHFERNPHYPESHSYSVYHFHPSMFHSMISRECRPSLSARVSPLTLLHFSIDSSNASRECRPSLSAR